MTDEQEDVDVSEEDRECASCCSSVSHLNEARRPMNSGNYKICDICYSTSAGNVLRYPRNYDGAVLTTVTAIIQVGNLVREEVVALRREVAELRASKA